MTEVVAPIHGRRLDARFALLEKLGAGGQGEVWRAHDDTRGIDIALKVPASAEAPDQSVWAAFEREHALAARLDHPSVLKVFPPHRSGELVVLPMELATGGDLRRLRGAGYLDIIPVLLDIAQALEHAHERGVIHRDLKPGNVLFDARGRVKLADFGAAGMTSTTAADARLQGLSPFTASPEQLRGEAPTESDDIYGLGALAYELLSGYPPYYPHFDLRRAQEEPVPNLVPTRQIPPLLTALVMRMVAKNKNERPRSMREVIDELDTALNDTLAFDFESIVDPTHGAPSAAVLVGPPPAPRSTGAGTAAKSEQRSPATPKAESGGRVGDGGVRSGAARDGAAGGGALNGATADGIARGGGARDAAAGDSAARQADARDEDARDDDSEGDDSEEDDDGPDLGIIPDLLVANALVVTPARKGARSGGVPAEARPSAPTPAASSGAVREPATKTAQTQALKSTSAAPPTQASAPTSGPASASKGPTTSAAATSSAQPRKTDGQATNNDTVYLPPDPESPVRGNEGPATPRGVGAAWRVSNSQSVNNDTMQLPPEPAPTRGLGAAWRVATARSVAASGGVAAGSAAAAGSVVAAGSVPYGQAANEQSIRNQAALAAASPQPALAPPNLTVLRRTPAQQASPPAGAAAAGVGADAGAGQRGEVFSAGSSLGGTETGAFGGAARGGEDVASGGTARAGVSGARGAGGGASGGAARGSGARGGWDLSGGTVGGGEAVAFNGVDPFALSGAASGNAGSGIPREPTFSEDRPLWENLKLDSVPRVARLEPIRSRRWPIVLLGILAGIAVVVFYWLPRYTNQSLPFDLSAISRAAKNLAQSPGANSSTDATSSDAASGAVSDTTAKLQSARDSFDKRLAALETRGAGVWGGPEFGLAKMRAAESVGARDAGNTQMAQARLADASHLLDQVESKAPQALAAQLAAGEKALATGQEELANQAFDLARRIDPNDKRIAEGQRHTHNLNGVLPLLADGQNAENARNFSRAAQVYSQALSIDPGNDKARAGLARANAAFGDDNYAKAVGSGFAALGAGRLDDAHDAFEKARALRPNGAEAAEGLRRVGAALSAKGFASLRQKAAGLEAQERWDEAVQSYDSALQADPSLAFAQEGKDRAAARAELSASMQALIDRPERLSSPSLQNQAKALLDTANQQSPSGPVLRSQIARLGILVPDYDGTMVRTGSARADLLDKPVRLSLVSDNATAVAIPSIGQFGTFSKHDIQLKPGRYTVIGTRDGFRDVRRDITIAPGQESQTISVSCSDPI